MFKCYKNEILYIHLYGNTVNGARLKAAGTASAFWYVEVI